MIKLIKSTFFREAETKQALADFILHTDILSMGDECRKFEESFARKQARRYAVYVSNGSIANLLLIQSLLNLGRLAKGDRVGFSALTWPTNVMPLIQLGLVPVAVDCELDTLNVSPATLEPHLDDIKALFITNVLGFSDDIKQIKTQCEEKGVLLLEDNCESLGSKVGGTLLGNFGLASTFSFFVGHHMSTIEGGMVCTDDTELHNALLMARAHGWDRNLDSSTQNQLRAQHDIDDFYAKYTFYDLASNCRPTEINGFIGNTQIAYWDNIVSSRAANFARFWEAYQTNDDFLPYDFSHMDLISNFSMPVLCKTHELTQHYLRRFIDADVEVRPVIAGDMSIQPFYKKYVPGTSSSPNAAFIHTNGFYFGNNPEMTEAELSALVKLLGK